MQYIVLILCIFITFTNGFVIIFLVMKWKSLTCWNNFYKYCSTLFFLKHVIIVFKPLFTGNQRAPFFANASLTLQLLMSEKKLELAKMNKHLEEVKENYRRAAEKFLTTRDKYNNLSQIGSDTTIYEGQRRSQRVRRTPEWQLNYV